MYISVTPSPFIITLRHKEVVSVGQIYPNQSIFAKMVDVLNRTGFSIKGYEFFHNTNVSNYYEQNTPPSKRYYLHKKVKEAFKVNATRREVIVPQDMADTIKEHPSYRYIEQLMKFGYNIQLTIT